MRSDSGEVRENVGGREGAGEGDQRGLKRQANENRRAESTRGQGSTSRRQGWEPAVRDRTGRRC
jgi:hypothetical protein